MKLILLLTLSVISLRLHADVASAEQINAMLLQMVKQNIISNEQATRARFSMKNVLPSQLRSMSMGRNPASVSFSKNNFQELGGSDLDSKQFNQIQSDIKRVRPDYRE